MKPYDPDTDRVIRALKTPIRIPDDAPDDVRAIGMEAMDTIVAAMRGQFSPGYTKVRLQAAGMVRDEICGPIVRKVEIKASLAELLTAASADVIEGEVLSAELPVASAEPRQLKSDTPRASLVQGARSAEPEPA